MKLSKGFRDWIARRGALVIFFVVLVLLWIVPILLEKPEPPPITRTLGSSTQHVEVLWFRQDISPYIAASDGMLYAMPLSWYSLAAFDIKTGSKNWEVELPFERSGVRGLLANEEAVFTVNATRADAYELATGKLKWSAELGVGHVSVFFQLDSGVLRIYYGNMLYEFDPNTGRLFHQMPKDTIAWVSGDVVLKVLPENKLTAVDKQTGKLLWSKCDVCDMFYINEGREPQDIGNDILIVGYNNRRICALDLQTGEDKWCRHEAYISKVAVDHQSQIGYVMRNDFVLMTIDLQTGSILGETIFQPSEPSKEYSGFLSSVFFSNGVVVVSFYDSRETFGLSFSQSSAR